MNSVRNDHSIAEYGEIIVESLKAASGQSIAIPFEVFQYLFFLCVNPDNG